MSMTPEQLDALLTMFGTDVELVNNFVHGDENTTVTLGNKSTDSLRRMVAVVKAAQNTALSEMVTQTETTMRNLVDGATTTIDNAVITATTTIQDLVEGATTTIGQASQVAIDKAAEAAGSASAARTSETAAKTSEINAAGSASAARTSETAAKTSEINAAGSASAARTSETAAKTSETNAAGSASAARTSETAVEDLLATLLTISPEAANIAAAIATHNNDAAAHAPLFGVKIRKRATANMSFYVREDGSDANDGLAENRSFLTFDRLVDEISRWDFAGKIVTLNIGPGIWTKAFSLVGNQVVGASRMTLTGAANNATVFDGETANPRSEAISLSGFSIPTTIANFAYKNWSYAFLSLPDMTDIHVYNMLFGEGANTLMETNDTTATFYNLAFTSGGAFAIALVNKSSVRFVSPITVENEPAYGGAFLSMDGNSTADFYSAATITGQATGKRYRLLNGSGLNLRGAGETKLPGNQAGTVETATGCWIK